MDHKKNIRESHFPVGIFAVTFVVLLLVAGIHMGIIQLFRIWNPGSTLSTLIIIFYWVLISAGFTAFTRWQMKRSYENPMKALAKATDAVAHGDFSVYVPPLHTSEKLDYLDVMIMDFNTMVEELGSIETLKTDFFSNVSHEIKTPIAVILNSAQMLQDFKLSEEEQKEYVETIISSSKKLSSLIANILKLNKLEKQNIQPEIEAYDLCKQLCECALQFEGIWEEKKIAFEAEIEDRAMVYADRSLMELVWTNLLSNAMKFTKAGGTVKLSQACTAKMVTVSVTDNGCGMDADTRKHIFDKFYQGDTSHSTNGNGLGLALVQRILQMQGGYIQVWSAPDKGSVFTVCLPVKEEEGRETRQ